MTATQPPDGTEGCTDESACEGSEPSQVTHGDYKRRMRQLTQTIETELIPRLLLAFGPTSPEPKTVSANALVSGPIPVDLNDFVDGLLNDGVDPVVQQIAELRSEGFRLKQIYLELLAPAARELGRRWEDDSANFTDVTVGVTRLHRILHVYSHSFCAHEGHGRHAALKALILPVPGEQHIFGQLMVIEFFRRAGWTVWSAAPTSVDEVAAIVAKQSFDVVGVSIGSERHTDELAQTIEAVRRKSSNPGVRIMLGGNLLSDNPGRVQEFDADGTAGDGQEAVALAFNMVNAN
ncbi:MAG: cobalamin B12-binding domain-containing protein [Pseudomonadota bacterium]